VPPFQLNEKCKVPGIPYLEITCNIKRETFQPESKPVTTMFREMPSIPPENAMHSTFSVHVFFARSVPLIPQSLSVEPFGV